MTLLNCKLVSINNKAFPQVFLYAINSFNCQYNRQNTQLPKQSIMTARLQKLLNVFSALQQRYTNVQFLQLTNRALKRAARVQGAHNTYTW